MRLYFKQRFFSWLDSYDIYDERDHVVFTVEGRISWGHCLHVLDAAGNHIATVKEKVLSFLPRFELYIGDRYVGCISKEFTLFRPSFTIDCNDWSVEGEWMEWDYEICSASRGLVAVLSKELFHFTDAYLLDIKDPDDALGVLMVALAIDAEKCSRN